MVLWTRHNDTKSIVIILKVTICQYTGPETNHPLNKKEEKGLGAMIELKHKGGKEGVLRAAALGASALFLIGCIALFTCSLPCKG